MKIKLFILLTMLTIALISKTAPCNDSSLDSRERAELYKAYELYERGEIDKSLEVVVNFKNKNSGALTLLGLIYQKQKKFKEALDVTREVKHEQDFLFKGKSPQDLSDEYYLLLYIGGISQFNLGNCRAAIPDLSRYSEKYNDEDIFLMTAICQYKIQEFSASIENFKKSFYILKDSPIKDEVAYNIGAISAILLDESSTIKWLKIPLGHDKKYWLEKVQNDKDFDKIRYNKHFMEFINSEVNKRGQP